MAFHRPTFAHCNKDSRGHGKCLVADDAVYDCVGGD